MPTTRLGRSFDLPKKGAINPDVQPSCLGMVLNIPKDFRAKHLRDFFNDFVEKDKFVKFHYRHRCVTVKSRRHDTAAKSETAETAETASFCCAVEMRDAAGLQQLIKRYSGRKWMLFAGVERPRPLYREECCLVSALADYAPQPKRDAAAPVAADKVAAVATAAAAGSADQPYRTRREKRKERNVKQPAPSADGDGDGGLRLLQLAELAPPTALPQGNVGTPTPVLFELIQQCRLPSSVLRQCKGMFSGSANNKYGAVPPPITLLDDDIDSHRAAKRRRHARAAADADSGSEEDEGTRPRTRDRSAADSWPLDIRQSMRSDEQPTAWNSYDLAVGDRAGQIDAHGSDSDDGSELVDEWDRHEEMHGDADGDNRYDRHDRLETDHIQFEKPVEFIWDKGDASGLVM